MKNKMQLEYKVELMWKFRRIANASLSYFKMREKKCNFILQHSFTLSTTRD